MRDLEVRAKGTYIWPRILSVWRHSAQERAWYDKNRERLMQGVEEEEEDELDIDAKCQYFKAGGEAPRATSMAPGVGVSHLLRFHSPSIAKDMSDSATSFYGTFRRLFERLAEEDRVAGAYPGEERVGDMADAWRDDAAMYPSFGHPDTPYMPGGDNELQCVRAFYQFWGQFGSRKCFAWKDLHDTRHAKDRRMKRLLEKENKRARDAARREYNEAIQGLTAFLRRRDPRVKAHQAQQAAKQPQHDEMWRQAEAVKRHNEKRAQAESFQAQSWQVTSEAEEVDDFSSGASLDEEADSGDEPMWECVACNKRFQTEAAWSNHERSKKHKKEVEQLKREMLEDDLVLDDEGLAEATMQLSVSLEAAPSRKKEKKKRKQQQKLQAAMEPEPVPRPQQHRMDTGAELFQTLPHLAELPMYEPRPPGSFDIFGYGSILFKPPPHAISYTPGYIQGFVRRFAQHSEDHRGTPEKPGRVVTLVSADHWHSLPNADEDPAGDIVWGISYTIDPAYADEVRAYLDHREKNGYTPLWEPIYGFRDTLVPSILVPSALVYVGLPDNPAFVGPEPLDQLAERIFTCEGPSGRNDEYLLRLADAVRVLTPQSADHYLFSLEQKVLALRDSAEKTKTGKTRRKAKPSVPPGSEVCNVCRAAFPSRSKLFAHVREKDHALARKK